MACRPLLSEEDLFRFRTKSCRRLSSGGCDFGLARCQYSHNKWWNRRCPVYVSDHSFIRYVQLICPKVHLPKHVKGSQDGALDGLHDGERSQEGSFKFTSTCERGWECPFAHSREEALYHPLFYKTVQCQRFLRGSCSMYYCPFIHGPSERRHPKTYRLPFTAGIPIPKLPNVLVVPHIAKSGKVPFQQGGRCEDSGGTTSGAGSISGKDNKQRSSKKTAPKSASPSSLVGQDGASEPQSNPASVSTCDSDSTNAEVDSAMASPIPPTERSSAFWEGGNPENADGDADPLLLPGSLRPLTPSYWELSLFSLPLFTCEGSLSGASPTGSSRPSGADAAVPTGRSLMTIDQHTDIAKEAPRGPSASGERSSLLSSLSLDEGSCILSSVDTVGPLMAKRPWDFQDGATRDALLHFVETARRHSNVRGGHLHVDGEADVGGNLNARDIDDHSSAVPLFAKCVSSPLRTPTLTTMRYGDSNSFRYSTEEPLKGDILLDLPQERCVHLSEETQKVPPNHEELGSAVMRLCKEWGERSIDIPSLEEEEQLLWFCRTGGPLEGGYRSLLERSPQQRKGTTSDITSCSPLYPEVSRGVSIFSTSTWNPHMLRLEADGGPHNQEGQEEQHVVAPDQTHGIQVSMCRWAATASAGSALPRHELDQIERQ
ncbi:zinc finger domain-containing protein [Cyclospora cayetanensis]|uniref:Zinc finger domain-containing protein n=1 Tax=Cyclospora cayetanensis TaxID=88456 RepID=A0A1D3CSE4_9EIME|nr:zinc finger domain-containing protein [Cyclospora cayetanensis]